MPVVKTPALTHRKSFLSRTVLKTLSRFGYSPVPLGLKSFSPYTMSHCHPSRLEQSSCIKIRAPYIDGDYSSPDFAPYGDCNGKLATRALLSLHLIWLCTDITTSSFSQCPGPLFTEADMLDSGK